MIEPQLIKIPAGPATLGVPEPSEDYPMSHRWSGPRQVEIAAFQIGRYSITRDEYEPFLRDTGHPSPLDWDDPILQGPQLPVCGVSAQDADAYCNWLAEKTGEPYRLAGADEWEKAARGGAHAKRYPWGDENPAGRCCFGQTSAAAPEPVGTFAPNRYGLYDMVGNIWQWLADLFIDIADDPPTNTPTGRPAGINRVLVGGSFMTENDGPFWVAYRHEDPPDLRHRCLGFRVAV